MKCGEALNDCIVNKIAGQLFIINSHPNFKGENKRQISPFLSGIPRQVRLDPGRDPRGDRLRGGKDEHRYEDAVCLHPRNRRSHVQVL